MDFFKRIRFLSFRTKDVIDETFLDAKCDKILNEFDKEYRFKDVNELKYLNKEIETNFIYAATTLWTVLINASHNIYKKIQILEADYSKIKSTLDNKLDYELIDFEEKRQNIKEEIKEVDIEIQEYKSQTKAIENEYHQIGEQKKVKGSLKRVPPWIFLFVMVIAGAAELFIYKNVFMSQEIGLISDHADQKLFYEGMAITMAVGFTVMLIWLAHKLGELLRHFDSATNVEKSSYYFQFIFISVVVVSAIMATVVIRGNMHEILAKDKKIELMTEQTLDNSNPFQTKNVGSEEEEQSGDNLGFGSNMQESEEELATENMQEKQEKLRDEINKEKGDTAWLFTIINIFIVVGGLFLSYETHTSSKIYETLEVHIKRLETVKIKLEKELAAMDKKIMKFKDNKIDPLFTKLLLSAALYDKEVRTYNAYMQIFSLKMQLIEAYIKKKYEERNVSHNDFSYKDILHENIIIDSRKELHHVNNIEGYMVYKYKKEEKNNNVV